MWIMNNEAHNQPGTVLLTITTLHYTNHISVRRWKLWFYYENCNKIIVAKCLNANLPTPRNRRKKIEFLHWKIVVGHRLEWQSKKGKWCAWLGRQTFSVCFSCFGYDLRTGFFARIWCFTFIMIFGCCCCCLSFIANMILHGKHFASIGMKQLKVNSAK